MIGICAALMLGFTFVNWYGVYEFVDVSVGPFGPVATHSAWDPFTPIDVVVAATAVLLLLLAAVASLGTVPRAPSAFGWSALFLGVICGVLISIRITNPPNVLGPQSHGVDTHLVQRLGPGSFLTLAGAVGVAIGGLYVLLGTRRS